MKFRATAVPCDILLDDRCNKDLKNPYYVKKLLANNFYAL